MGVNACFKSFVNEISLRKQFVIWLFCHYRNSLKADNNVIKVQRKESNAGARVICSINHQWSDNLRSDR